MPQPRQMTVFDGPFTEFDLAAMERRRIRIRGTVIARGNADNGGCPHAWLRIRLSHVTIQLTASTSSELPATATGKQASAVLTLTGMLDLAQGVYYAE